MNRISAHSLVAPNMHLITIEAPEIATKIKPGQFVIVRAEAEGERIPLSVADWDDKEGTITIVFMEVGASTASLSGLKEGDGVPTCVGPLGLPSTIARFGTVLAVGGCYGIGSIFPTCRALQEAGNEVLAVFEARSSYLLYWLDRFKAVASKVVPITRDGTRGIKGHIDRLGDIINGLAKPPDRVVVNGCTYLLRRTSEVTKPFGIKTIVNLNPIMIDGTGMCGVCRVSVGGHTRFACVDGPEFDGHEVDWDEFLARRKAYLREEVLFFRNSQRPSTGQHPGGCQS